MRRTLQTAMLTGWLLIGLPAGSAHAREMVFARANDVASLEAQSFSASYAFETGKRWNPSGTEQLTSLKHRLQAAYGLLPWLQLSMEQTIKHHANSDEVKPGVTRPELRLSLSNIFPGSLGRLPVGLSTYVAGQIRTTGRRDSAVVWGIGARAAGHRLVFTANAGVEVSVPDRADYSQVGPRYDMGISYECFDNFAVGLEAWGHASWSNQEFSEQEHAVGPTVFYYAEPFRLGVNGSVWLRHMPGVDVTTDIRGTFVLGLQL